jgi:dTDP-4-amino-4,6-dideoxygalactose transaminase
MLNSIFSPWPKFSNEEIEAAKHVLSSGKVNYWTGQECKLFEEEFADYVGANYAISLMNGTVALELALKSIELNQGDEVIVTPRSFMASVSSVVNVGAVPVFADVDLNSGNIEAESIEKVISDKTRAIVVVHLAGMPADMKAISKVADRYNLRVIEDCAQAHGAKIDGKVVGTFGDIGVWSFCQDKIMTTAGEGGMLVTNNESIWKKAWSLKDHGKDFELISKNKGNGHTFKWLHTSFGSNYRMTEVQAAIGRIQLRKLDNWLKERNRNAEVYTDILKQYPCFRLQHVPDDYYHAYYKYYVYVRASELREGWTRDKLIIELSKYKVPVFQGSCSEIYREKAFDDFQFTTRLPNAKRLFEESLMFLVHPGITKPQLDHVMQAIRKVSDIACK